MHYCQQIGEQEKGKQKDCKTRLPSVSKRWLVLLDIADWLLILEDNI